MLMCPEEDQADPGNVEMGDELPAEVAGRRTRVYRSTKDNAEAIELTDDELEEIAGGLLEEADKSSTDDHPASPPA